VVEPVLVEHVIADENSTSPDPAQGQVDRCR
jgi:hypothetical protein